MKRILSLGTVAAAAALMAACASAPTTPSSLVQARSVVQTAQADPMVLKSAPLELQRASDALARAEKLHHDDAALSAIDSAAYVATREVETARAIAEAKRNEEAIQAAELERERLRADAARTEAIQAQTEATTAKVEATLAQQAAVDAALDARNARANATAAAASNRVLQQQLAELQAQQTDRGMLVTLGDVLFETGRATVKPAAQGELAKLVDYLKQHPERLVLIEGYTDSVGSESFNLTLSQKRADAVARALMAMGVAPSRIATTGYGESYPVADNASASDRALNRRVEVYISDDAQPVRARG
ncbi:MAG: OmpA family protein [Burkholderiaceae bacterium]|nr:OmpA family protein [Burkholderiaceae bacterium]